MLLQSTFRSHEMRWFLSLCYLPILVTSCVRNDEGGIDDRALEQLFAERADLYAEEISPTNEMPLYLKDYVKYLDREIMRLDLGKIDTSVAMFEKMDPWVRECCGNVLLVHYGSKCVPKIKREILRKNNDSKLKGAFLKCIYEIVSKQHEYNIETIDILIEALQDNRGYATIPIPSGKTETMADIASKTLWLILEEDEFIRSKKKLEEEGVEGEKRNKSMANWLITNKEYLYAEKATGKLRLDAEAKRRNVHTKKAASWPLSRTEIGPEELPSKISDIHVPTPGP